MHAEASRFVQQVAESIGPRQSVVEIGSRNVNGTIRGLFHARLYTGIDPLPGPDVDLVANGATYRPTFPVDTVICCEVLEHTEEAEPIIANALGMLDPLGVLIVTCAAPNRAPHSAIDGRALRQGEYYRNVDPSALSHWVERHGGEVVVMDYQPARGDLYLWARKA